MKPRAVVTGPAVSPRLRILLAILLAVFGLLAVNSFYLGLVTFLEWWQQRGIQDQFYQFMFLFHLVAGLALVVPAAIFIASHLRRAWRRPNRNAVRAGLGLLAAIAALLASGLLLVRFDFFSVRNPAVREIAYWVHVVAPLLCVWLFVLHRLAGPRIRWRSGLLIAGPGLAAAAVLVAFQVHGLRAGPAGGNDDAQFAPSLMATATGEHIPARELMMDEYCAECHADVYEQWSHSAHRFASFNNPVYLFAVRNTRQVLAERDGDVAGVRVCAGCHDVVPMLSGALDDPGFDDVHDPTAAAGINCTVCHAVTSVDSPRGNADLTITAPRHYPFAFSDNALLAWVNRQLIKAKPDFHRRTFLKPLHRTPEFCGACHKVHLPEELNRYQWLRGQNHYDSFLLSGVSGHGVASFYYPPEAEPNCNGCHMVPRPSDDFSSRVRAPGEEATVLGHLFPAANTALPHFFGLPPEVTAEHREMLTGSMRLDIVALREGAAVDGRLVGPLRPQVPVLQPGREYLLQLVLRNLRVGHAFTQGTSDSNETWVELEVLHDGAVIARSGGIDPVTGAVDPWAHFANTYMLDRDGQRIDRRNAEDIFVPLYDHQVPPGAADLLHYRLAVPEGLAGELEIRARLHYRKFDTRLMQLMLGPAFAGNDLPITTLAEDALVFEVGEDGGWHSVEAPATPAWERWNDYGIGALRKPQRRQLRQAEEAFGRVEALGRADGSLNLARTYLQEGRLDEAAAALRRALEHPEPAPAWSGAWFGGQLLFQQGRLEEATAAFTALAETRFAAARQRGFDFSRDYRLLNQLGLTWLERARQVGGGDGAARGAALREAREWFLAALAEDPENSTAHYNLARVYAELGDAPEADRHRAEYARYRVNDNARDHAVAAARRANPAANHAADPVVVYDLHRPGRADYPLSVPAFAAGLEDR
ncbi:multiheme c-type cytochrome [Thioalkalivibrio sp. XN8]|uniref:tetratricopeptide repeat protein n=1 Tax=Thioalkalivibrio sp. XN8 TaxID=2712863 RepID=UPI0013EB6430|nr:multiheme c-type cytochrome [Thioalkalivibrio sp. XN8]NGP54405.1 tetratricopeptide repeat protein [Thioalkalivibrio sp. XN8]